VITELGKSEYLLLTTYRKNGTPVATPVWVVGEGDVIYAWSAKDTGKVKRLRNSGKVDIAPCDFKGNPKGDSKPAHAQLMSDDESDHVRNLIVKKYGFMGRLTMFGSKIRRGRTGTIGIKITDRQPEVDG
jgi:uncharacterized protein